MRSADSRLKVLSVVGAGRSGTTLLASILDEVDGVTSAGELRWLWQRGILERRPCGCGRAPSDCPTWAPVVRTVLDEMAAGSPPRTVEDIVAALHSLGRPSQFPRLLRGLTRPPAEASPALSLVRAATKSACLALAQTTRARVIVDISKRPLDAVVLAGIPTVDHYIVHMFRDPRAVVHSWRRAKSFTAAGESRTMGTRGLTSTVRRWMRNSVSAEALRRRVPESRWLTMRYEDLAASPRTAVAAVLDLMEETGRAPFLSDDTVLLRPNHIVAGNPSRFDTGPVTIRSDDAWRVEMPGRDQRLVSLLTRPLLGRYGYPP